MTGKKMWRGGGREPDRYSRYKLRSYSVPAPHSRVQGQRHGRTETTCTSHTCQKSLKETPQSNVSKGAHAYGLASATGYLYGNMDTVAESRVCPHRCI